MKHNILTPLLLMAIVFCIMPSCQEKNNDEKEFISAAIANQGIVLNDYKYVVIIPGIGCHGCIQESEYFLKQNINNKNILFIISNPQSLKILQNKIKVKLNDYDNVIVDRKSTYELPTNYAIYPCVLYLDENNHDIIDIDFQSPKNGALNKLNKLL